MDRLFPPKCPLVSKKDALIAEVPIIHGMTDEEALIRWRLMDMMAAKATSTMKETEQKDNETNWRQAQENHQASTHTIRVPAGREVLAPPLEHVSTFTRLARPESPGVAWSVRRQPCRTMPPANPHSRSDWRSLGGPLPNNLKRRMSDRIPWGEAREA